MEILLSVIGFHHDKIIDLLNLEQKVDESLFTHLRIKKDENVGIMIENLIQMGTWSRAEFISIYNICKGEEDKIYVF
jgi:hypothetical protein